MKPDDAMSNVAKEAIDQTNAIKKRMTAEADAVVAANAEPAPDNTILADADPNYRPLSEIAAAKTATIQVDPTILVDVNTIESFQPKQLKSSRRLPILIGLIAGVVLLLGLGIWGVVALFSHDPGGATAEDSVTAFFLARDGGDRLYAAFNSDGQRLTDFTYATVTDFRGGYALVTNSKAEPAILANTGKLSVPFDEYQNIERVGANYLIEKGGDKQLINAKGERLMYVDDAEDMYGLTVAYSAGDTVIFDNVGNRLGNLVSNLNEAKYSKYSFVVLAIETKVYLVSVDTGAIRASLDIKDGYKSLGGMEMSGDGEIIIFYYYSNEPADIDNRSRSGNFASNYVIVWGDKVYDNWDYDKYDHLIAAEDLDSGLIDRVCSVTGDYCIDEGGAIFSIPSTEKNRIIHDHNHYAYLSNGVLTIIAGDKTIKVENAKSFYKTDAGYLLNGGIYYDEDGEVLFDQTALKGLGANAISGPDQNGNYVMTSGDGAYLLKLNAENKFEELASAMRIVYLDGNYLTYELNKSASTRKSLYQKEFEEYEIISSGLVSARGEVIISADACRIIKKIADFYLCKVADKQYDLYRVDGTRALQNYMLINIENGYIGASRDGRIEYYTLAGQKFYEN